MALALGLRTSAQDCLAGHVNAQLGRVEHLDTEDVVLAAVAGAERLGHGGDTEAEQLAALARFFLLLLEGVVADGLHADLHALVVLTGVGKETERRAVREHVVLDQVHATELRLIHTEVVCRSVDHALLEEHGLGHTEGASVGDATRCLVRVVAHAGEVSCRDVVAREGRVHEPDLELGGLSITVERTVIGDRVHAHAQDLAVLAHSDLALQVHIATEAGRDEVAGVVLNPLHRTLGQDRREDRDDVAGVDRHLVAEAATEVGRDDADLVLGDLRDHGHCCAHDVRSLAGHVDGELAGCAVVVGDGTAVLHRRRVRTRVVKIDGGDDIGVGKCLVSALLVADLPLEDLVSRLVFLVIANDRHGRVLGLGRIHDGRQLLVLDDDLGAGILGHVRIVSDNRRDFLALEAHLVGGHDGLSVVRQGRHPCEVTSGQHVARNHQADAGHLPRSRRVDRLDARMRDSAAQDLHVQHAGKNDVIDVLALTADKAVVLDAAAACAHSTDLDFVQ